MPAQDYITEIPYISGYYSDLTPARMSFIAAVNNFRPPDIFQSFSYCELGCGCGKTTNIVAASYPQSDCVGIDVNKEHIRIARNESAGLSNIKFFDMSFSEASRQNFKKFDFITMHGVWSWVGDSVRADILRFVKKFLKTGGLFCVSYNAMPGWTQLTPFHKIISTYIKGKTCSTTEKATSAMAYLQFLNENKSPYFERNPDAKVFLQTLEQSDMRYVIHELFNQNLRPEYFCDVAADMKKAGLTFVGNSEHIQNYQMTLSEPFKKLLNSAGDRIASETHKSVIQNDRFRKDVYIKRGSTKERKNAASDYLEKFMFGTKYKLSDLKLEVSIQNYTLTLKPDPYLKIFEALSKDQLTIKELNEKLGRPKDAINETWENVANCALTGQFCIFLKKANKTKIVDKFDFTNEYNRNQILNWDEQYSKNVFVASETLGDAIAISKKSALILSAIHKFGLLKDKVVDHVYDFVCDDMKKGRNIFGFSVDQDIRYLISYDYNEIVEHLLDKLSLLGIITCG